MINKEYWDNFYKSNLAPQKESSFAQFTYTYLKDLVTINELRLIDVGCGNGRDTFYFSKMNIKTTGIDLSYNPESLYVDFTQSNILEFDYKDYNVLYLRFIVHSLTEPELDKLISNFENMSQDLLIFIETRSSKNITDEQKSETYFKSSIGSEHFRMLYSEKYLTNKLEKRFKIVYVKEDTGFSPFNGEDPFCIRYILKNK